MNINAGIIKQKLEREIGIIFREKDNFLCDYEKRKLIFDYLCKTLSYDWDAYKKILNKERSGNVKELYDTILFHKGVCNSIAEYYKLLLQEVGIYSLVVVCTCRNGVKHALNLVYNAENNTFSLDDITSAIIYKKNNNLFFDYDFEDAKKFGQGLEPVFKNKGLYWAIIPSYYIDGLKDKYDAKFFQKFNLENKSSTRLTRDLSEKFSIKKSH